MEQSLEFFFLQIKFKIYLFKKHCFFFFLILANKIYNKMKILFCFFYFPKISIFSSYHTKINKTNTIYFSFVNFRFFSLKVLRFIGLQGLKININLMEKNGINIKKNIYHEW